MKKNLIVKQDGYKECASACLLSIIRFYGGNISINKLVELTKTDKFGTNFYNIKTAANEIGLEGIGYKVDQINKLKTIKVPFICQIIEKNYEHFIVVYKVNKKYPSHRAVIHIRLISDIMDICTCALPTSPFPLLISEHFFTTGYTFHEI